MAARNLTDETSTFERDVVSLFANAVGAGTSEGSLAFDGQDSNANFNLTDVLTGATSGATGTIAAQTDSGATGLLFLTGVAGSFTSGERVVDATVGRALAGASSSGRALSYDNETGTFTEGLVVTGATSGATGTIAKLVDSGATGVLYLTGVTGSFMNNEALTDSSTGVAIVDGALGVAMVQLAYTAQGGNFTAGLTVTGGTSGATGVIMSQTDSGATGTLLLSSVTGTFANNEALTDSATGAGVVDGTLTGIGVTSLKGDGVASIRATGTGLYTVTLEDLWAGLLMLKWAIKDAGSVDEWAVHVVSEAVATTKVISIAVYKGGVLTALTADQKLYLEIILSNSANAAV